MLYSVKQIALHHIKKEQNVMKIELVRLYDVYAPLLSERQREVLNLYYNEDESLAEISENIGITRQGVRDCIVKSENQLKAFESALGTAGKTLKLREMLEKLLCKVNSSQNGGQFTKEIEEIIEHLG